MANKKLQGFEQDSSSEEGSPGIREMVIEENETLMERDINNMEKDINRIQTPNLEPHDLNFSDMAHLNRNFLGTPSNKANSQSINE